MFIQNSVLTSSCRIPVFWIVAWVRPKSWNSAMKASTGAHIATTPKSCGDSSRDSTMTETIWVATRTPCAIAVTMAPRPTDLRNEPSGGSNALVSKFRIPVLRRSDMIVTGARRHGQTTASRFCSATKIVGSLLRCTKNVAMQQKLY